MPISQNTALFSLLGTYYGGDGKSTFALPDMQGNAPMHPGQGPGLSLHDLGEIGRFDDRNVAASVRCRRILMPCMSLGVAGNRTNPIGEHHSPRDRPEILFCRLRVPQRCKCRCKPSLPSAAASRTTT